MKIKNKLFIERLESCIEYLAKEHRGKWKEALWESENIEEFGFNEFIGGKADAYEDCLEMIRSYKNKKI